MKIDADKRIETEPIPIGEIIEDELRRQERTVTWLSRKIHCDRRNVYDIFSRTNIDTELLYKLSVILGKDFFTYYSHKLQIVNNKDITPPRNHPEYQTKAFPLGQIMSHFRDMLAHIVKTSVIPEYIIFAF